MAEGRQLSVVSCDLLLAMDRMAHGRSTRLVAWLTLKLLANMSGVNFWATPLLKTTSTLLRPNGGSSLNCSTPLNSASELILKLRVKSKGIWSESESFRSAATHHALTFQGMEILPQRKGRVFGGGTPRLAAY